VKPSADGSFRASDGLDLAYIDAGAGPHVLLLHGNPFNRSMWQPQVEFLVERYRVVVPELRGYGRSRLPAGSRETKLETFVADCLALIDALHAGRMSKRGSAQTSSTPSLSNFSTAPRVQPRNGRSQCS
jgi:pimeloyl-ACP methyl ester carboxylesterase